MKKKDLLKDISTYLSGNNSELDVKDSSKKLSFYLGLVSVISFVVYLFFLIGSISNIKNVDNLSNVSIDFYIILTSIFVGISLIVGAFYLSLYIYNRNKKIEFSSKYLKLSYCFYQIYDMVNFVGLFLTVFLWIILFAVTPVEISGDSMKDTLFEGDKVLVWRSGYEPQQSDIIVIDANDNYLFANDTEFVIKRIAANSGDEVSLVNGKFYVNKEEVRNNIDEKEFKMMLTDLSTGKRYYEKNEETNELTGIVPEGFIIALGDNKYNSMDSKSVGLIHKDDILGKAIFRIYPFSKIGLAD